jgi:hypothetical protein
MENYGSSNGLRFSRKRWANVILGNSIKKQILGFGFFLCFLFIVQIYMIIDPNHLTGFGMNHYAQSMEQDKILKDLANMVDRCHELSQDILYETEETVAGIMGIEEAINAHMDQLKNLSPSDEWKSAYQTLTELHESYSAGIRGILVSAKSFETLKATLVTKSTKPIVDILEEVKLLGRSKEQNHLQSLVESITGISKNLTEILGNSASKPQDFESLNKPMESITTTLSLLLPATEDKPEVHAEIERVQTLVINYFSAIHQMKDHLLERPKLVQDLGQQEKLFVNFVNDLTLALKENQKEIFQDIYKESKQLKRNALLASGIIMLMLVWFLMTLFFRIQKPLENLAKSLRENHTPESLQDNFKKGLHEIQGILNSLEAFKTHMMHDFKKSFHATLREDNQRIESKLNMLANSAVELGKVSASIARIPMVFDKKFASIYEANDETRIQSRHMVQACENINQALESLVRQVEKNPAKLSKDAFEPLKHAVDHILSKAHEAAVESQTLGLRFNSLLRTKDDTLEVSKLFSKAGTRVNQLARSLREDVHLFFEKMQTALPEDKRPSHPERPSL